jgi:penicillin-binding protein 2
MSQYVNNPEAAKEYLPRYKVIYAILTVCFIIFTARLWYLQMIKGNELREFSEKNRIKEIKVTAPRGIIFDRDGKILVENLAAYDAVILPQYVDNLEETAQAVGSTLKIEPEKILTTVIKKKKVLGPFAVVRVKENLTLDEVFLIQRMRIEYPGVEVRENIIRSYPLGENGAQLFGYVSEVSKKQIPELNLKYKDIFTFAQGDVIGKSGVEELLDVELRGKDGYSFLQVDAHGREISHSENKILGQQIKDVETTPGLNVQLTIDKDVQEAAYKAFYEGQRIGAIIAMKSNGEVLAWVSTPSFDPNQFAAGFSSKFWSKLINDPFKPLRNKVIQDHTSPGSTFKPFVAITALENNVITPEKIIMAPGSIKFGNRVYHDHYKPGFGAITVFEALERSSNVFFYKMGIDLGIERMFNTISLFGLGQKSGIELRRENSGTLPNSDWKKSTIGEEWQLGENLSTAIGQGFVSVTPIQMAVAYNAIGTEGKVVKPFLIKKIIDPRGQVLKENLPTEIRDLQQKQPNGIQIKQSTFKTVKEAMRRVVNGSRGTARNYKIPEFEMGGKTGTTQVRSFASDDIYTECTMRPLHLRHHGWFVAFAPIENPEITVAVLAEHACHGASGAAPIVRDIVAAYIKKQHPDIYTKIASRFEKKIGTDEKPAVETEGE